MKKHILLSALFLFSAVVSAEKLKVATSFTIIADIAQNIAGDDAEVVSITKVGAEIHEYEPTPQDLIVAQNANLILWNGLNLETWFEKFLQNLNNVPAVVVSTGVEPLLIANGDYKGKPNPHAWMSVDNAKIYIKNITEALIKHDPKNQANYEKRAQEYLAKLEALQGELKTKLAHVPENQRWLVSSEGAFSYLAKDLGFKEAYLWAINEEQQGTPKQVSALIETVKANQIPVVFSESTVSDKPAKQVAKESGAKYGGVLYVDSLSEPTGAVPTYLDLLKVTTDTIANGFQK